MIGNGIKLPKTRQHARIDFNDDDPQLVDILQRRYFQRKQSQLVKKKNQSLKSDYKLETEINQELMAETERVEEEEENIPEHLKLNEEFMFIVSIVQLTGISKNYADVFCQFNFRHRSNEAFSTESIKNTTKNGRSASFNWSQNISVCVTRTFIKYLQNEPLIFELYGHYQHHPLHKEAQVIDVWNQNQTQFG